MPPVLEERELLGRRGLLKAMGFGGILAWGGILPGARQGGPSSGPGAAYEPSKRWVPRWDPPGGSSLYPARRNGAFEVRRPLTPEDTAATENNYYEFLPGRAGRVHELVGGFEGRPWTIRIRGEVEEERTLELDDIPKIAPLEERFYHFRCVEAWSMVVPWTGIPLAKLVEWSRPKPTAKYVRFVSFHRPDQAPGQAEGTSYPWPYYEGLRMDEATHPLALLVTGIYGHGLPVQHGAPARVIVPWKYGFKSPKGIEIVEFTAKRPPTFWNDLTPSEYSFLSNVEPDVPHPRWSQATERDIATDDRIPTLPYNGYAEHVARLYPG